MNQPEGIRLAIKQRILAACDEAGLLASKREVDQLMSNFFYHGQSEAAFAYELEKFVESKRRATADSAA